MAHLKLWFFNEVGQTVFVTHAPAVVLAAPVRCQHVRRLGKHSGWSPGWVINRHPEINIAPKTILEPKQLISLGRCWSFSKWAFSGSIFFFGVYMALLCYKQYIIYLYIYKYVFSNLFKLIKGIRSHKIPFILQYFNLKKALEEILHHLGMSKSTVNNGIYIYIPTSTGETAGFLNHQQCSMFLPPRNLR